MRAHIVGVVAQLNRDLRLIIVNPITITFGLVRPGEPRIQTTAWLKETQIKAEGPNLTRSFFL